MSKHQALKAIRAEIARLNQEIDLRIIKGLSYRQLAEHHKVLTRQLARLRSSRLGWFGQILNYGKL